VALHHSPCPSHTKWHNRLTDADALIKMLGRVGADLVIHGHMHRHLRQSIDGPAAEIPVVGVASGTWLSPRHPKSRAQYNLYRVEEGRLVEITTRRYDPGMEAFLPWDPSELRVDSQELVVHS